MLIFPILLYSKFDVRKQKLSLNHKNKNYGEVISKRILIIFAPEEAEIFKDYLFNLA
jgi:hypothetical protein